MRKLRFFARFWLPVLVWMTVIFSASSDRMSFQHSSRIIEPFLRWLMPSLSADHVWGIVFFIRKCSHFTEYCFLALLACRALKHTLAHGNSPRRLNWRIARVTVLLVFLYAASDEFHQRFVPHREASVVDVLIDTSGGVAALVALWAWQRFRRAGKAPDKSNGLKRAEGHQNPQHEASLFFRMGNPHELPVPAHTAPAPNSPAAHTRSQN